MERYLVGMFFSLIASLGAVGAQEAGGTPSAELIVQRVLERAKLSTAENHEGRFTWTERVVSEELDDRAAVKSKEEKLYEAFPIGGSSYSRLVRVNGAPLSAKELKKEQEREQKFRQELQSKRKPGEKDDSIELNEELLSRFRFVLIGQETVGGRTSSVVSFEPKGPHLPEKRRTDRLVNRLRGRLWVDREDYEITRVEAQIIEPVKMWGGLLATIRTFAMSFTQTRVEDGIWLPGRFDLRIQGRVFIKSFNEHQVAESTGFRRIS